MTEIQITEQGTRVLINGVQLRLCFTPQTNEEGIARFVELIRQREAEVLTAHNASEQKRQWNYTNPEKGRNWPEFRSYEKLLNQIQQQAGIKDT